MNYLNILYDTVDHDLIFSYLKKLFGQDVSKVSVIPLIADSYVRLEWDSTTEPTVVAQQLTEACPSAVIETVSTTDIEKHSRFFNSKQLW